MTGAIVREWLEMSAGQFNRIDPAVTTPQPLVNTAFPTFNYDVIDGVTYRIDVTQPARYTPQGKLADAQRAPHRRPALQGPAGRPTRMEFIVVTNNYRASGGGNFPGMDGSNVVYETAETNQEIIKDWLIEQRTVDARGDADLVLRADRRAGPGRVRVLARGAAASSTRARASATSATGKTASRSIR